MKFRANKILGLAIGERSILVAEVSSSADECQVARAGVMTYADGITLEQSQAIGEALAEFLKQGGYAARSAIFGIPAKWVVTKPRELPPVDPSLACDMLRMQVESEFSSEIKDLVYDYAGQTSATATSQVMLAAMPRRYIERIEAIAKVAQLDVQGITPTAVALSTATAHEASDALILSITPSGTELAAQRGASPALLRHVGSTAAVTANVAGEVRRAVLQLPRNGATAGNGSANGHSHGQIVVWNDSDLDPLARRAAMDALGPSARSGQISSLGAGDLPAGVSGCAAAVALAIAGVTDEPLPIDFLNPRLAAPKKALLQRQTIIAIAAGVSVLLIVIFAWMDLNQRQNLLAAKRYELSTTEGSRKAVESEVAMIDYARNWHAGQPRYLDCLRDLTLAFPGDGLYATSLTLHDNMQGSISGKSTQKNDANVRKLAEKLRLSKDHFADVNTQNVDKQAIKAGQEYKFTITFKYLPAAPPQP